MTYHAFGDSITAGTGNSVPAKAYAALTGAALGLTVGNHGVSTQMVFDGYDQVIATAISAGDKCSVMWGTNDEAKYDADPAKLPFYIDGLRASLVRIGSNWSPATPTGGVTFTGGWGTGYAWGMYGSPTPGSKATFAATGSHVVIGMLRQLGNSSTFRVKVAGVDKGVFNTNGAVTTLLNRQYGPYGLAFVTSPGDVVELSVVSADASNPVYFHWYSNCTNKATVVAINTPHAVAYTYGGSSANVDTFNAALASLVAELAGYGLDVRIADVCSLLTNADMFDNVHPNDSGHQKIANAVYAALTGGSPIYTFDAANVYARRTGGVLDGTYWVGVGSPQQQIS